MMLTISDLQRDLIEKILSMVPLSYMRAVRLTCKNWNNLSKIQSFTKLHIGKLVEATKEGESQMVMMLDNSLCSMSVVSYTKCKGNLTCLEEQTRWIEPRFSYRQTNRYLDFNYALGYENKSGRHNKLLRFIDDYQFSAYEMYDFEFDLWTSLVVHPQWRILSCSLGVPLKGNTYWCATKGMGYSRIEHVDHLILQVRNLDRFCLFHIRKDGHSRYVILSCVREEKLAALFHQGHSFGQPYPRETEIWITTSKIEFEKDMCWNKLLTVDAGPQADIAITPVYGSFFIDEVKKVAMIFDTMSGRTKVTMIGYSGFVRAVDLAIPDGPNGLPLMCPYVPSSVRI